MTSPIEEMIDTRRYPIFSSNSTDWHPLLARISAAIDADGCAVLEGFILPEYLERLARQVADVAHLAYDRVEQVNVYNTDVTLDYPKDHPGRITMERGNAFVARDMIGSDTIISQLYQNQHFKRFIARSFGLSKLYELDDPYAGLCGNVLRPGLEHPWHFDTNEFTVSMVTQAASRGGIFEYCPNIRTPVGENRPSVLDVLTDAHSPYIKRLELRPGDLQLFKGRYSLHRVTRVQGETDRHSAIFAYSEMPGVVGEVTRTRQLFGRVHEDHHSARNNRVRSDQLMD